jgi:U2-associated protein SR140
LSSYRKDKRQLDDFLDEIKTKYESGGSKDIRDDDSGVPDADKGSYDNGDPATTNLYVGNLAPSTTGRCLQHIYFIGPY